jgi:hypothetical protein
MKAIDLYFSDSLLIPSDLIFQQHSKVMLILHLLIDQLQMISPYYLSEQAYVEYLLWALAQ